MSEGKLPTGDNPDEFTLEELTNIFSIDNTKRYQVLPMNPVVYGEMCVMDTVFQIEDMLKLKKKKKMRMKIKTLLMSLVESVMEAKGGE